MSKAHDKDHETHASVSEEVLDKYFHDDHAVKSQVNETFTAFMTVVILLNTVQIGVTVQWPGKDYPTLYLVYQITDIIFCACYIVEVIFKLRVLGVRGYFYGSAWMWNAFDFVLTGTMLIELINDFTSEQKSESQIEELAKVARTIRIIRILQVLRRIQQLTIVVGGLGSSTHSLGWIMLILLLCIYTFGIFFTLTIENEIFEDGLDYFVSLDKSMSTLTDMVVGGVWGEIMDPVTKLQPAMLPFFMIFVIITVFGLLNLIVGVICDATTNTKDLLEWQSKRMVLRALSEVWLDQIRARGLGVASLEGLQGQALEDKKHEKRQAILVILDNIISEGLLEFPPGTRAIDVFEMLDEEGRGELTHKDFVVGLGRILLGNQFQLSCLGIIETGRARRMHRNEQKRKEVRDADMLKHIEANADTLKRIETEQKLAAGANAAIEGRLSKIEEQLATIVSKLGSK